MLHRFSQDGQLLACLGIIVFTYVLLYFLYCSEFGVNPFNPGDGADASEESDKKSLDTSIIFQVSAGECNRQRS